MDLKRLGHLVALAEERNFARAAKRVHLSQPAFSRSIEVIEAEFGLPLFERGGAEAVALYRGIFAGGSHHEITFTEAVTYNHTTSVLFVGREFGNYSINGQALEPLEIRATRLFTYEIAIGRWVQLHHHRSIEDPDALRSYQNALIRR